MPIIRFPVTPTITAGAYSANDVIGGLLTFTGCRRGTIQSISITDKAKQSANYTLLLFDDVPTTIADNATYDIADADLEKIIYQTSFTSSELQSFTDNQYYFKHNLAVPIQAQCTALRGYLFTTSTPTYASTSDITVSLQIDTDYVSRHQPGQPDTTLTADHGLLDGLADDDHPQYFLVNGSRDITSSFIVAAGNMEMNDAIHFDTGVVVIAAEYSIVRDADGTNQLHFNVPSGAGFEFSINDTAELQLDPSLMALQSNILELNSRLRFDTGVAVVSTEYSVHRDADATNQFHFNVPTGASFEFSVNDSAVLVLDSTGITTLAGLPADAIDAITEIAAALKSGADPTLITGTAGASGNIPEFNADGDLIDSGKASSALPTQATQAALEGETNEDTYAPPDLIKHSPGVAKVFAKFDLAGTVNASYNVDSVTDNGTGDWTINITTDFSSVDYIVLPGFRDDSGNASVISLIGTQAVGSYEFNLVNTSNTLVDGAAADDMHTAAFGDQ